MWGVKKVVFAEKAEQTQATYSAQINLEHAEKSLAAGNPKEAREYVRRAQASLAPVSDVKARSSMDEWIGRLNASAESAIKAAIPAAPRKQAERKAPAPKQAPPVTDDMPQFAPPPPTATPNPVGSSSRLRSPGTRRARSLDRTPRSGRRLVRRFRSCRTDH